jgi:hypothetical protein
MAGKLGVLRAGLFAAVLIAAAAGCRGASGDDMSGLAGIYGTWASADGYTVVLLADTDQAAHNGRLIGMIPGTASGRVLIKEAGEGAKWRAGIYKLVKDRILTRSSDQDTWAVTFTCDLRAGKLFMPGGDGKQVELFRSAKTAPVRFEEPAPGK